MLKKSNSGMQMKEFCEKVGLSRRTIEILEWKNIISPQRIARNNYRVFTKTEEALVKKHLAKSKGAS